MLWVIVVHFNPFKCVIVPKHTSRERQHLERGRGPCKPRLLRCSMLFGVTTFVVLWREWGSYWSGPYDYPSPRNLKLVLQLSLVLLCVPAKIRLYLNLPEAVFGSSDSHVGSFRFVVTVALTTFARRLLLCFNQNVRTTGAEPMTLTTCQRFREATCPRNTKASRGYSGGYKVCCRQKGEPTESDLFDH